MFANFGKVLVGQPTLLSIPFYGTRVTSKIPLIYNIFNDYRWAKGFGVSFLKSTSARLKSSANGVACIMGYIVTIYQYYKLLKVIFGKPDFDNCNWTLF